MSESKKKLAAVTLYLDTLGKEIVRLKTDKFRRNLGTRGQYDEIRWREQVITDLTQRMEYPDAFEAIKAMNIVWDRGSSSAGFAFRFGGWNYQLHGSYCLAMVVGGEVLCVGRYR